MLTVKIPGGEFFDEEHSKIITIKPCTIQLEHSLVSVSKWEAKWHKAFFGKKEKTNEEVIDYIRCMTITQNVDPRIYQVLSGDVLKQIGDYIEDPHTATHICERPGEKPNSDTMTSELIYYWMISFNIPPQYEKWHLNRLLTLIRVCSVKSAPPKKFNRNDAQSRAAMNASRKKALHTRG